MNVGKRKGRKYCGMWINVIGYIRAEKKERVRWRWYLTDTVGGEPLTSGDGCLSEEEAFESGEAEIDLWSEG
jgi:hypothetical protein